MNYMKKRSVHFVLLFPCKVSDLEEQMVSLGKQLKDSAEQAEGVTNTLSQKTAYISQLESIVEQQKGEILNWNTSQLQVTNCLAISRIVLFFFPPSIHPK